MNNWATAGSEPKRRRTQRVILSIAVTVSGETSSGTFSEDTRTLVINAHGALVTLVAKISSGQNVNIKTQAHPKEEPCRVVYVGPTVQGKTQFGLEFVEAVPDFWRIAFPPENWSPVLMEEAERKSKTPK